MSISQFASLYDGQEVFVWSDCLLDLGTDFLVGNSVFVLDAKYLAVAPHFHGLSSSLELKYASTTPSLPVIPAPDTLMLIVTLTSDVHVVSVSLGSSPYPWKVRRQTRYICRLVRPTAPFCSRGK